MAKEKKEKTPGYEEFHDALQSGAVGNVYIFHGEETYLMQQAVAELQARLVPAGFEEFNYHRLAGKGLTMQEVVEAAEAMPMMAERTLVTVEDMDLFKLDEAQRGALVALLEDFPEYCTLVFLYRQIPYKTDAKLKKLTAALAERAQVIEFAQQGQQKLRCGYTTGTCAALGAAGAARLLLTGRTPETVALRTPKGIVVEVEPIFCRLSGEGAECAIRKDGGDDVDVTTGLPVIASVALRPELAGEVRIHGGEGVGRVTKPGLDQPVGEAAINHVPRAMIKEALEKEAESAGYAGGFDVTISIEGGAETAKRTFNPHMGVEGGLSVLGTSGIVEPMSQQAILDTIQLEMGQAALRAVSPRRLILAPGNYGLDYLHEKMPALKNIPVVKTSNFIGDTMDMAAASKFEQVVLVGHIGKLVKLAGGVMNTHSRTADCRTELLCAHAALCGASRDVCAALMNAATTDACMEILDGAEMREPVLSSLLDAIQLHLDRRAAGAFRVGAVLFSNQYGPLGQTRTAKELLDEWKNG